MISVDEAHAALAKLVQPLPAEHIALRQSAGRVLIEDVTTTRLQPPFDASAMDGYALKRAEVEPDALFKVVGESAAGRGFDGTVGPGQTVRIFTGAPVPKGADTVVIQEDVTRRDDLITLGHAIDGKDNIRPAGGDFKPGQGLGAPRRLRPADVALLAAMNISTVPVARKPVVAILSTGDELVEPGETPGPDQIIASNSYGLAAQIEALGAEVRVLPIARDSEASLRLCFGLAQGADLLVTIGGASVGDHDLVGPVAASLGMEQSFYKVAMRPGKPLLAGRLGDMAMVGLPGNPVSALVCGTVFVAPMIRRMLGLTVQTEGLLTARLGVDLAANGTRAHYMRAQVAADMITPASSQDSSLLRVLADANALLVRPVADGPKAKGDLVHYLPM